MEEKKQPAMQPVQTKKLSYDELNKVANDIHAQYQKLVQEYQKVVAALNNRQFDYMSFLLQMLFKVMEHPEMYSQEFVKWASANIEESLQEFAKSLAPSEPENKGEVKKADEAE